MALEMMAERALQGDHVSLIIPLQDEQDTALGLLESVASQSTPPTEVIVVDAGSRDQTRARVESMSGRLPLRVIEADRVYPGVARNAGAAAARCAWLAFTDGGIILDTGWLCALMDRARTAPERVDAVFGTYDPICDSFFKECAAIAYVPRRNDSGVRGPFVASCVVKREVFSSLGGFPPHRAAEDLQFIDTLRKGPYHIEYAREAVVHWQIAGTLRGTFGRFAQYSAHNLAAGWGKHWHQGLARLYFALALMVAATAPWAGWWSVLLIPGFFLARGAKAGWLKRRSFEFHTLHPLRVAGAAGLLLVLDAATGTGVIRWLKGGGAHGTAR